MRRLAVLIPLFVLIALPAGRAQTPEEMAETAGYAAGLQNADGGFAARPGEASSLGATSGAIRALKYAGGSIPDVPKCIEYVRSCVAEDGGLAPTPGGESSVQATAVGLMALVELNAAGADLVEPAVAYLADRARDFSDIRIAVAGLEAVGKRVESFDQWAETILSGRNDDGTWGSGASRAFDTGGSAATLLRMGRELDRKEAVVRAIVEGQNEDGGWSEGDGPSTISASYRVMRAVYMLRADVDLDALLAFLARHRHESGGYAPSDGQAADISNTYYAAVMIRWAREMRGEPAVVETAGFVPLFNGADLSGWEGDTSLWKARDGAIVGDSPGIRNNAFLATEESFGDFVLKLTFRMRGDDNANSGIMFHAERLDGHEMRGYQADVGQRYWGSLYDESRRKKILAQASPRALEAVHHGDWNHYVVRAAGGHVRMWLNGVQSVDYREEDPSIPQQGRIALQVHSGGPMTVEFKDIAIQRLPMPKAESDASGPGWHLRTIDSPEGTRKYTVYVPEGYDGEAPVPVVLFLHGRGERGDDGIIPAQTGLGPAIARDPSAFPAIAVFPQAREGWAADSADARAALAALDDVKATYNIDEGRIALTGLSMGGFGSWELATAYPDRFSAVAVVCGFTPRPAEVAEAVKGLPLRMVVGDADMPMIFNSMREMGRKLREAGADLRSIEYRGVGHNSWDRAYNDSELIEWMLAKSRGR